MNTKQAMRKLYSLALFGPGAKGATFANVLLRAEQALAESQLNIAPPGDSAALYSAAQARALLIAELTVLRINLQQRQELLQRVHDALFYGDAQSGKARKADGG